MAVLLRATFHGGFGWMEVFSWVALVAGTFTGGVGLSFMGYRNRLHASEHDFLVRLTALLHVEKGVAESLRLLLGELAAASIARRESSPFGTRNWSGYSCGRWFRRRQAAGSRESPADRRRPVSLRSSGSQRVLAAGEWNARGVWMESRQRPASAGIAADAGGGQGTAGGALDAGRDGEFRQPAGGKTAAGEFAAPAFARGFAAAGTRGAASGAATGEPVFAAAAAGAGHRRGAQPHLARPARRDFADAAEHRHPAGRAAPQGARRAGAGGHRPGHAATDGAQRNAGAAAHGDGHAAAGGAKRRFGGLDAGIRRALPQ